MRESNTRLTDVCEMKHTINWCHCGGDATSELEQLILHLIS